MLRNLAGDQLDENLIIPKTGMPYSFHGIAGYILLVSMQCKYMYIYIYIHTHMWVANRHDNT